MLIVTVVRVRQGMAHGGLGPSADWFVPFASITTSLGLTAPPVLLGLYVGARRRLMESLRERADSLERELPLLAERAEERAEWARGEERTRIAREMHDVVAHRVSLMVVHAAALQAVAPEGPEKAVQNAALVGDMGRQALTELREMLGVLRSGASSGAGAPAGAGAPSGGGARSGGDASSAGGAPAAAVPSPPPAVPLAAVGLAAAAAASRGAEDPGRVGGAVPGGAGGAGRAVGGRGMAVDLSVEGECRPYAAEVEQTAFRVVQEALTNVHKHAAGAKTTYGWRTGCRRSRCRWRTSRRRTVPSAASARLPSGGNGLVGMKERVVGAGRGLPVRPDGRGRLPGVGGHSGDRGRGLGVSASGARP